MPPIDTERILVVEDDDSIATGLCRALTANGYVTERVGSGQVALDRLASMPDVDLVLLDLGLPDMDGIDVCRAIRAFDTVLPIVMLTARSEEIDVVVGLDAGAVDYLAKPLRLAELIARIRVQLRRPTAIGDAKPITLRVDDVRVDLPARRVWLHDAELSIRAKEFDLLVALMANAGTVMTRERLMAEVWDEHWFGSTKTLDVHIASLRRRLGEKAGDRSRITALRAIGYRYEMKVKPA